ncbi:uncharacterized protein LOC129601995 isoform X2 [Paramacrobiotus metropolitanus]|uniref:uncharacterized protein LOC129601995 isoform X2 n=1 Tax=Paramacrobiotus metropolitanus TaxID=2943436 RepID=UPI0024461546|nr:uncharacterized protein LOC129601995 isoform X2 [Paramacrobiotus metropolitanus]
MKSSRFSSAGSFDVLDDKDMESEFGWPEDAKRSGKEPESRGTPLSGEPRADWSNGICRTLSMCTLGGNSNFGGFEGAPSMRTSLRSMLALENNPDPSKGSGSVVSVRAEHSGLKIEDQNKLKPQELERGIPLSGEPRALWRGRGIPRSASLCTVGGVVSNLTGASVQVIHGDQSGPAQPVALIGNPRAAQSDAATETLVIKPSDISSGAGTSGNSPSGFPREGEIWCYRCHKNGHRQSQCRNKPAAAVVARSQARLRNLGLFYEAEARETERIRQNRRLEDREMRFRHQDEKAQLERDHEVEKMELEERRLQEDRNRQDREKERHRNFVNRG